MESNKPNIIDLRIILLGDSNVGKKSIVERFKKLKSTETKEISLKEFLKKKKLLKNKKEVKIIKQNPTTEEEKRDKKREDKRISLMRFTKIYRMEINSIHISFCPLPNAEPLQYDYEPKDEEEDENYEFEKEYKISIKNMMSEIKGILMRPPDDTRAQIEILFLLCFDLTDFSTFENLVIFFSQINKTFKLIKNDFKLALIGTKLDIKKSFNNEERENFDNFKNQLNLLYYEISSLMFFNFEKFFEKLIIDIYGNIIPFLSIERYRNLFHEILITKNNFSKTKRDDFLSKNEVPGANKYNNNVYDYPKSRREMIKMFQNKKKYNYKIFINKNSILFPPIKDIKEELNSEENIKKNNNKFKEEFFAVNWDTIKNEDIQSALELNSNIKGYSFGVKSTKSLGLKKQRDLLRDKKEKEIIDKLDGYIVSSSQVLPIRQSKTTLSLEQYQEKYEQNRSDKWKEELEDRKEKLNLLKIRHDEMILKNSKSFKEKIKRIEKKRKKYDYIIKTLENEKKNKKFNTIDVDNRTSFKYVEPKGKYYDPIPSISTNKGFTFGQKLYNKEEPKESPDFPTFMDDFEKLIEKNKKRHPIKSFGNRFPVYKTEEIGDSSYVMDKQKDFEKRRRRFRRELFSDFFGSRIDKREEVLNNKKMILENQENKLKEQIKKSYKTDENYLLRDINYDQIETSSPKYTIKGKSRKNNLFNINTDYDDDYNHQRFSTISGKEIDYQNMLYKPNFNSIYPKHPAFSFGSAKRFNIFEKDKKDKKDKNKKNSNERYEDYFNNNDIFKCYQDTQSFLVAQTSMGTSEKLKMDKNENPGPGMYKIKGFADDVALRGSKINLTRIKLREKEKDEEIDKERRAKLRELWNREKKSQLKISIKDYYNFKINKDENKDEINNKDNNN